MARGKGKGKAAAAKKTQPTPPKKRSATDDSQTDGPPPSDPCIPTPPKASKVDVELLPAPTKPHTDKNQYRAIKLPNGIRALLIHTPNKDGTRKNCKFPRKDKSFTPGQPEEALIESFMDPGTLPMLQHSRILGGLLNLGEEKLAEYLIQPGTVTTPPIWVSDVKSDVKDPCGPGGTCGGGGSELPGSGRKNVDTASAKGGDGVGPTAAISVVIHAGASDGPKERNGLAHFCEHAVHYGSKAFPEEDSYFSFLLNTTTGFNAYTATMTTTYYFDIKQDYLHQGVSMLADMLAYPIFNKNLLEREVHAIDNEFVLRRHYDIRLASSVLSSLAKKDHPLTHFGCGDLGTLLHGGGAQAVNKLREDLVTFHKTKYVGTGTTLAIQSSLSLDDMEKLIVDQFMKLPRGEGTIRREFVVKDKHKNPFDTPEFNRMYIMAGKSSPEPTLTIQWALPPTAWMDLEHKPLDFLSELIHSEWEHGLGLILRSEGLILAMRAGCPDCELHQNPYVSIFAIRFVLNVHTTQDNKDNDEEEDDGSCGDSPKSGKGKDVDDKILPKVHRILEHVFEYLGRIRGTSPERRRIIRDELAISRNNYWDYSLPPEGSNLTMEAAQNLQLREGEDLFSAVRHLPNIYNDDVVRSCLDLMSPEKMVTLLTLSPKLVAKHKPEFGDKAWKQKIEPHYKTVFWGKSFDPRDISRLKKLWAPNHSINLSTMTRNPFDSLEPPTQNFMDVKKESKLGENEKLIILHRGNAGMEPASYVASVGISIFSSSQNIHHQHNSCRLKLLKACLEQILEPMTTAMAQAGIFSRLLLANGGEVLHLRLDGFPEKLPFAMMCIMFQIFPPDEFRGYFYPREVFSRAKAILMNGMIEKMGDGNYLTGQTFTELMTVGLPSFLNNPKIVSSLNYEDFLGFTRLVSNTSLVGLVVGGNVSEDMVNLMANCICSLDYFPKTQVLMSPPRTLLSLIPYGNKCIRVKSESRKEYNSIVTNLYEFAPQPGVPVDVIVEFLSMYMRSAFFFSLRTRQQIGYSIGIAPINFPNKPPMIMAQVTYPGSKKSICEVDAAIDTFFLEFEKNYLSKLDDTGFKRLYKMLGIKDTNCLDLKMVKTFYRETFLTEIDQTKGGDALLWRHTSVGKVRKLSIQILAEEEKCTSSDCKGTEWTQPEGSEGVVSFSRDGVGIAARYISEISKFRDSRL